eukprot:4561731-Pyramimonas_sp.AAC.1
MDRLSSLVSAEIGSVRCEVNDSLGQCESLFVVCGPSPLDSMSSCLAGSSVVCFPDGRLAAGSDPLG